MKWIVDQLHRFINKLSLPCLKHKRNCLLHNQKFYEIVIESQNHRIIKNIPYLHSQQPQPQQNQTSYSTAVLSRYICICIVAYLIASTFGVILFLKYDNYPPPPPPPSKGGENRQENTFHDSALAGYRSSAVKMQLMKIFFWILLICFLLKAETGEEITRYANYTTQLVSHSVTMVSSQMAWR